MIRSISYSRYLRTAVAMAVHRPKNATLCSTFTTAEFTQIDATNTRASTSAAAAHHFVCRRSSPDDLANLTTTATTLTSSPALIRKLAIASSSAVRPSRLPELGVNGCVHNRLAATSVDTVARANAPPANHAAGRHRRERSRPVGKSKNKKPSAATATIQIQLDSQANTGPAGRERRAATNARSAYWSEKPLRPSASPATRNSQPIRFSGRLDARTKPVTGTAMFTTCPEMLETVQPVRLAGTNCRST